MHRTTGADNAANMFVDGPPGTVIDSSWLNDVQETIIHPITTAGIALVAGTYTQLTTAIGVVARTALQAAANTWALAQTFSKGIVVNQSTTNTSGITVTGNGAGAGLTGFAGSASHGIEGTGSSAGASAGVHGTAGGSGGYGMLAQGVSGGVGLAVDSSATNVDVAKIAGYVNLGLGAQPASTAGFSNQLTKKNICKAWGYITTNGGGGVTVQDGFNISGVAISSNDVVVTFASAMANANYAVIATGEAAFATAQSKLTTSVHLTEYDLTPAVYNPATQALGFFFAVFASQ